MMKLLRVLIKTVNWIVTIGVIASIVAIIVLPYIFGIKPYIVLSGSMEPTISTGGLVWINTREKDIQINDIAAYELPDGEYVTHRVIAVENDEYIFKGDANETEDLAPVRRDQIVGKYMFAIPQLGKVLAALQHNKLLYVPIISGIIALMLLEKLIS
jgi:signal peptidase